MNLLIVESPTKARKIRDYLGSSYRVEPSLGHVREIPPAGMNVDIKNGFEPTFAICKGKADTVKTIKDLAKKAEKIYLATDADREGEAISWHIYDLLDKASQKKCKRVTYTEVTKQAVQRGIDDARGINMNLVNAQKARQVLDRLIGYKVSPVVWYAVAKGTSAGRVQSVALKLICERQKEIDAFKPVTYWLVDANLKCENGDFWARVVVPESTDNRFLDEKPADNALANVKKASLVIGNVEKKQKSINPNPPFDTSSLTTACSSIFRWSAPKTMTIAQELYESGKISYHRGDSYSIAQEALDEVRKLIAGIGPKYLPDKPSVYVKKSTVASQEAHECIRPTHVEDVGGDIGGDDKKMYDLVRDRFIACQMTPMVVSGVKYTVKASTGEELVATGQTVLFDGYSKVWKHTKIDEQTLPSVEKGESLTLIDTRKEKKQTKPPDRYNDGSLTKKMEAEGVGRPSTRAAIIKAILEKGYVERKDNALIPLPIGMAVCDFLVANFGDFFMDIGFTAQLEERIDKITRGEDDFLKVVGSVYEILKEQTNKAKKDKKTENSTGEKCPVCKKGDIVAKVNKRGIWYACGEYPDCNTVFDKTETGFVPRKPKEPPKKTGKKCPKCGKPLVLRKSAYGEFTGCSGYPSCKFIEKDGAKKEDKPVEE
jgi:DNA topoisomerase-1